MKRWQTISLRLAIALAAVGGLLALLNPSPRYMREQFDEGVGFGKLTNAASDMIREEAPGVVHGTDSQSYIESFQAFHDYIKVKHPSWAAGSSEANPFPSILPEARYGKRTSKAEDGEDLLLWSETIHEMNVGRLQYRLLARGGTDQKLDKR